MSVVYIEFDLARYLQECDERDRQDSWTLTFRGVCPRCDNKRGKSYTDHETGEREWVPCHFCLSEQQIEDQMRGD